MTALRKVVVVGAGLGAHNVVTHLRQKGFDGEIEVIGDERLEPYDRPPLSKDQLWSQDPPSPRLLASDGTYDRERIAVRTGTAATGLDPARRVVTLADGNEVNYDALVIATGARARTLSGPGPDCGVLTLRSFDDCLELRTALLSRPRVVVVGAGLIGCEVAGHAASIGMDITVIDPQPTPLGAAVGPVVGARLGTMQRDAGSRMLHGVGVEGVIGDDRVEAVRLSDGSTVPAELVLVAFGATPNVDWLRDSGLKLARGIICDELCRTNVPDVYAIGDVAETLQVRTNTHRVVEHWNNAREQGAAVADTILGNTPPPAALPYFWTDQVGSKIQALGWPEANAEVRTIEWDAPKPGAMYLFGSPEKTTGAVSFNASGRLMKLRAIIESGAPWTDAESLVRK
ncbi:NAD(P)/FAD-dependent oxidoreductase [Nocardia sp. NPDC004278]